MIMKHYSFCKILFGVGATLLALSSAANAQTFTSSDLVSYGEIGMAAGIGSWNDAAYDHKETTDVAGHTLTSSTTYTGAAPAGLAETLTGNTRTTITSHLGPGSYSADATSHAQVAITSGSDSFTNPAAIGVFGHNISFTTGPAGSWHLAVAGTVVTNSGGDFSLGGQLIDHTAGWSHPFSLASASPTISAPYAEDDFIAAGDNMELRFGGNNYGFLNPNLGSFVNEMTSSISLTGPASVPEPSPIAFLGLGLLPLLRRGAKK